MLNLFKIFNYLQNIYTNDELRNSIIIYNDNFNNIDNKIEIVKRNFNENFKIIKLYDSILQEKDNIIIEKNDLIRQLFFKQFILYYDNLFSIINEGIYFHHKLNIFNIFNRQIKQLLPNMFGRKISISEDFEEDKYFEFKYFITEFEKLIILHMKIEKEEIRYILYKINPNDYEDFDNYLEVFYNNLLKKRREEIEYNDFQNDFSENIDSEYEKVFNNQLTDLERKEKWISLIYKKYLKENILQSYELNFFPNNPRFQLLKKLYNLYPGKKFHEFPEIIPEEVLQSCNINFSQKTKKECIVEQYFFFIDYNFTTINKFKLYYIEIKNKIIDSIKRYNSKIMERKIG